MAITAVKECLLHLFLVDLNEECNKLCQKSEISIFRKMDVAQAMEFQWAPFITELQTKSPLSYAILFSIASRSDKRNICKVGSAHFPGLCMAAAVILKERNRVMCGVQSLLSLLHVLYSCHCEKKVDKINFFVISV